MSCYGTCWLEDNLEFENRFSVILWNLTPEQLQLFEQWKHNTNEEVDEIVNKMKSELIRKKYGKPILSFGKYDRQVRNLFACWDIVRRKVHTYNAWKRRASVKAFEGEKERAQASSGKRSEREANKITVHEEQVIREFYEKQLEKVKCYIKS